jgi:hypothetical protein
MANNYKTDEGKPPVVSAVFIPFRRTLLALAEMMGRQKIRHQLQGAKDPFQEWRHLPEGKGRLLDAGGRHALDPWSPNTKDRVGDHPGDLHILHAIWGLMAAYEKHLEEGAVADSQAPQDGPVEPLPDCPNCQHPNAEHDGGFCYAPGCSCPVLQGPIQGPAGADWREKPTPCPEWITTEGGHYRECRKDRGHKGPHEDNVGLRW